MRRMLFHFHIALTAPTMARTESPQHLDHVTHAHTHTPKSVRTRTPSVSLSLSSTLFCLRRVPVPVSTDLVARFETR